MPLVRRRVDEGALEIDGRDPRVPFGLLGDEEVSMAGCGDSVRINPASFVSDGGRDRRGESVLVGSHPTM